jgi:hypothetical protein
MVVVVVMMMMALKPPPIPRITCSPCIRLFFEFGYKFKKFLTLYVMIEEGTRHYNE